MRLFRWTHGLVNRLVTLSDVAALAAASAVMIAFWPRSLSGVGAAALTVIETAVFVLVQESIMAYRIESYYNFTTAMKRACAGLAISVAAGGACVAACLPGTWAMLLWFAAYNGALLFAVSAVRIGAQAAAAKIQRDELMRRNTLVIGNGPEAEAMIASLTAPGRSSDFRVVGCVAPTDFAEHGLLAGRPLLGGLSILPAAAWREAVDLIVIAVPLSKTGRLAEVFEKMQAFPADVFLALDGVLGRALHGPVSDLVGHPVVMLARRPLKGSQAIIKFIEDEVICALALLVLSPLMLAIALAIRLDSPGPALFRQDRVGRNGRIFRIYKFRTMTVDPTDDGTVGTTDKLGARITRVGRFLRASSLDELAQLLNVLRGDMSVVGPRPYVPGMLVEGEKFEEIVGNFRARQLVKPGITGLAQSNGIRSNALRNRAGALRSVQQDLHYIARWSVWLDMQIMIRTVMIAMSGPEIF